MTTRNGVTAPRRVLLVDDDAISLDLTSLLLGCDGHQVMKAPNGETALQLLAEGSTGASPDVLLVDMQMPGVSGKQLAEQVRALTGPEPLLLAMSASQASRGELRAFDGFLLKPLALKDLRQALRGKKRSRASTRPGKQAKPSSPDEIIDSAVVNKLRKVMPESTLNELFEACIGDSRSRALAIQEQVRAGQMTEVTREAHQIKGAALMVGATRIARIASGIELGSYKEGDTLRLLDDLLHACDDLERILLEGALRTPYEHNNI